MRGRGLALIGAALCATLYAAVVMVLAAPRTRAASEGIELQVLEASVPADRKPVVQFRLTDGAGAPIGTADLDQNSLRFTIAALKVDAETKLSRYVSYVVNTVAGREFQLGGQPTAPTLASATQAAMDANGVLADLGDGLFRYTFATVLPADYDARATHTVGAYATRGNRAFVANALFDFVPAGGPLPATREVVQTAACNGCHQTLAAHGGTRRDTRLCAECHTDQTVDPESGRTVDFKVMVHKIHSGADLPSVKAGTPYLIVGNSQSVHDYSDVVFPQDTRNCETCHTGAQGANWKTAPSAAACGSCHDDVDFATGANHAGGPVPNDTRCATCHQPDGPEFGRSVSGAHAIPERSSQLPGVQLEILSVSDTAPGQSPTVTFAVRDGAGEPIPAAEMTRLALMLAGPTTDYTSAVQETATRATPVGDGVYSYTFQAKVPAGAKGTFAIGLEGYRERNLTRANGRPLSDAAGRPLAVRDVGPNRVAYVTVTDAAPAARRAVVDLGKCNTCHETLALHGGNRRNTEYCPLCHNPTADDSAKRAVAGGPPPPQSISFGPLIHKIHTGEAQESKPFIIYGGSPASPGPVNLSEARFPGNRANCEGCHIPGTQLPDSLPAGLQPVTVMSGGAVASSTPPLQAACLGCHDGAPARAHAESFTTSGRESCVTCHGEGGRKPVSAVHKP